MNPLTIGPLVPGLYVIEFEERLTYEQAANIHDHLKELAPKCRFILLGEGAHIARNELHVTFQGLTAV